MLEAGRGPLESRAIAHVDSAKRRLGYRIGTVLDTGGALWAQGAYIRDPGDRVWKLDPRTGSVLGSALLPTFGTMAMADVDGALWITTGSGRVVVLPLPR